MSAALPRDALIPREPPGLGVGLVLALIAHALLIVALAFGVNWRASPPTGIEAELWAEVPRVAAPRAVEPDPPPPAPAPVAQPKLAPKVQEAPPPPAPDAQIAIEKARREAAQKAQAEREKEEQSLRKKQLQEKQQEKERQEQTLRKQQAAQRQQEAEAQTKKAQAAEDTRLAAQREANLKRMQGMAGASGDASSTGKAQQSAGPSASYAGLVQARIKRYLEFPETAGNPTTEVVVIAAPDGTILDAKVQKPSGTREWDEAVVRAIRKAERLPRDVDGRVPSPIVIVFRRYEF